MSFDHGIELPWPKCIAASVRGEPFSVVREYDLRPGSFGELLYALDMELRKIFVIVHERCNVPVWCAFTSHLPLASEEPPVMNSVSSKEKPCAIG